MTYLVGKIALDILAGAPNNGRGENNVAMVKQMWINGKTHPYVSAQDSDAGCAIRCQRTSPVPG